MCSHRVSAGEAAEEVLVRRDALKGYLAALWVCVEGDREEYAAQMEGLVGSAAVCLVVRDTRFDNANAVMVDLVKLLNANRAKVLFHLTQCPTEPVTVVLLGRTEFPVAQSSSPVKLPEWFPEHAGKEVLASIQDISWETDISLDSDSLDLPGLRAGLFAIEGALARRLRDVALVADGRGRAQHFVDLIRRQQDETMLTIVANVQMHRSRVRSSRGFRPSVRAGNSLVARLWELWLKTPPQSLAKPAKALSSALDLDEVVDPWRVNMLTTFARPSERDGTDGQYFCRDLLVVIASACQFVTSAAHADEYPRYPVTLLRSISIALLDSLREAENRLNALSAL